MVQLVISPSSTQSFLQDATVERLNLTSLNETRIRFRINLRKATRSSAPAWADVLKEEQSDLVKVKNSEVGLRSIKVFKQLETSASRLRQEIAGVQQWMVQDNGDWICSIKLAPLVWNQLVNIRDNIAPTLRNELATNYDNGLDDYQKRINEFLSLNAWNLDLEASESVKNKLLKQFPSLNELQDYLQVVIARPVIIPALSEQLSDQQAECLEQITKFIQQYDQNLEKSLRESAIAGGEQLAAQLLEDLAKWEPGHKPIQFQRKMERHLMKIQVLMANATSEASGTLQQMMAQLDSIVNDPTIASKNATEQGNLQKKINDIRTRLLNEQLELKRLADGMGLEKATVMSMKFR